MKKIILQTLFGLFALTGSIIAGYFFLVSLNTGANFLLLLLAIVLVLAGAYVLFRAAQADIHKIHVKHVEDHPAYQGAEGSTLERNNQLLSDWARTVETHSRLKTLKLSADAQEKAANGM